MASSLISDLYEAINQEGTYIVGADSDIYSYCLLACEIAIKDWGTTEQFNLYIQVPWSGSPGNYYGQVCFNGVKYDAGTVDNFFVNDYDLHGEETLSGERNLIFDLFVDRETYHDIFKEYGGTFILTFCAPWQLIQQAQLGKVTTSPESVLETIGLTTSLDDPYASKQLSTPSLSISCDDAVLATIAETESATTFHLEYRVSGTSTWNEYTGHIVSADSNVEVVDITDLLTGGTVYEFRAYCSDSSGEYEASEYSEIVSFKLFSKVAYKGVKSRTTSAISFYTTNLGLTSGTTWIAQYKKRGTDTWLTATTSNTSSQLTVSSNTTLAADSVYDFRIRLTRSEGESMWFYCAQATRSNQTAPAPTCTAGSTTIAATWAPPTGYYWYRLSATLNGTVVAQNDWTQETSDTLTGLTPGTAYVARVQYRITAEGDAYENDGYRGTVDVTTLSQLDTPTDLTATNITNNSADLGWSNVENASNYRVDYRIYGDTLWQQTTSN